MFSIYKKDIESFEDKGQDIRFTKQISATRVSNLPSKFHLSSNVAYMFREKDFDWGSIWLGGGHHESPPTI